MAEHSSTLLRQEALVSSATFSRQFCRRDATKAPPPPTGHLTESRRSLAIFWSLKWAHVAFHAIAATRLCELASDHLVERPSSLCKPLPNVFI